MTMLIGDQFSIITDSYLIRGKCYFLVYDETIFEPQSLYF